jgi:protein phosphatase
MGLAEALTASLAIDVGPKPRDDALDLFGITHKGMVREENQDQFLLGTIHQQIFVHGTSLQELDTAALRSQRLATIMLVADGVGGGIAGADASHIATERIISYLTSTMDCYHAKGRAAEKEFLDALQAAAIEAHEAVRAEAAARNSGARAKMQRNMATTMTLGLAVWPWLYVLQAGDSRCYFYIDGRLRQVTRDQTMAQDLVDRGALPAELAADSPFNHVLASSIGGNESHPVVSRINLRRAGCIVLLCSDGLTKHVDADEIAEQCANIKSSESLCRTLLDMALQRGGSDNTTIVAGRAKPTN